MKKIKYGVLLGLGMVLLSGCNASAGGNIDEKRWVDNASCEIFEVTDPQTGVHYLFFNRYWTIMVCSCIVCSITTNCSN